MNLLHCCQLQASHVASMMVRPSFLTSAMASTWHSLKKIILCVSCHVVSYRGLHLIVDVALFRDIAIAIINYLYWILLTMDHAIFSHPRCKRRTEKLVRSNDSSPGFKPPRPVVRKIQFMASELLSCHTSRLLIDPTDTAFHTSGMFSGCCTSEGDTEPQHHTMLVADFCFLADN